MGERQMKRGQLSPKGSLPQKFLSGISRSLDPLYECRRQAESGNGRSRYVAGSQTAGQ